MSDRFIADMLASLADAQGRKIKQVVKERDTAIAELSLAKEAQCESTVLAPSQICDKLHIQACFACERADCSDNTNPSIVKLHSELAAANKEIERLRSLVKIAYAEGREDEHMKIAFGYRSTWINSESKSALGDGKE